MLPLVPRMSERAKRLAKLIAGVILIIIGIIGLILPIIPGFIFLWLGLELLGLGLVTRALIKKYTGFDMDQKIDKK